MAVFVLLLALPFTRGFAWMAADQKDVYLVTVVVAAAAVGCLLAPTGRALVVPIGAPVRHSRVIARVGVALLVAAAAGTLYLIIALVVTGRTEPAGAFAALPPVRGGRLVPGGSGAVRA